jgi:hypothetical protein
MIHVTIFGGHGGRLQGDKRVFITLFGGTELFRPTIARQLLVQKQNQKDGHVTPRRPFMLTIFGGVEITYPTLAEEFLDLRELVSSNLLAMSDWDRSMALLSDPSGSVASFTMFGACEENNLPTEDAEVDSLASQHHLGNISSSAAQVLQFGIGQKGSERAAAVKRALMAAG